MVKENELDVYSRLPDSVVYNARDLAKNYNKIKDAPHGYSYPVMCDGGTTTVYLFSKVDGKPVLKPLCCSGDYDEIWDSDLIRDFVREAYNNDVVGFHCDIEYLMTGKTSSDHILSY